MNWTKYLTDAITWLTGGGFTLLVAIFIKNRSSIFDLLEKVADQTKTKKDNEVVDHLKALSSTLVTSAQPTSFSGSEQKAMAVSKLTELAKDFNVDLDSDKAKDYIEEAYQLIYGVNKSADKQPLAEQTKLVQDITSTAEKLDADNPPAIQLDDGDLIELNDCQYTLGTNEAGEITLTKKA
ncbi:hypothetical protein HC026_02075 [Lactobacillus sp. LC28-10]|uniref:Holin n=1 Tax=Secundilactobacillus angelensis TaxID=2722706 RepID=A0ABX1KUV0_9LACO|nr:hypothetical protein [Secundilactobacillus angelensis]MCH5461485.1 hypothetical protein [Secundilactobacillus angelensis]NLR17702.1 hypothetical protein [Secundilactobacillus angelensis]